jgi:hypothetical protein
MLSIAECLRSLVASLVSVILALAERDVGHELHDYPLPSLSFSSCLLSLTPASTVEHPHQRPSNVGIHAMEIYFPSTYVKQADLEAYDGVSAGMQHA